MSGPASDVAPGAEANLTAADVSLEVDLGKLKLRNPVLAASGAYGYGAEYTDFIENATIGGFVTKSVTPEAKRGNPHPRCAETPSGMLNSIGLENLGIDHFLEHEWPEVKKEPCTPILSVAAYSIEDYARMVAKVEKAGGADAIELNLSCPNVKEGGRTFGGNPEAVEEILSRCREETDTFLLAKLTPNADVVAIAQGAEAGGADGLTLINTLLGMGIDVERRTPLLAMGMGGLSGPAVKPVALAMTWQVRRVTRAAHHRHGRHLELERRRRVLARRRERRPGRNGALCESPGPQRNDPRPRRLLRAPRLPLGGRSVRGAALRRPDRGRKEQVTAGLAGPGSKLAAKDRVAVAFDVETMDAALEMRDRLGGALGLAKIGSALFVKEGMPLVRAFRDSGAKVFLDLKFHDIPSVVGKAVEKAVAEEVDYLTVHAAGGAKMIEQAAAAAEAGVTKVLAVTVLTSLDLEGWRAAAPGEESIESAVRRLGANAVAAGAHGARRLGARSRAAARGRRRELHGGDAGDPPAGHGGAGPVAHDVAGRGGARGLGHPGGRARRDEGGGSGDGGSARCRPHSRRRPHERGRSATTR